MQGTNYASATAIRAASLAGDWATVQPVVPAKTLALLQQESLISWADFWPLLRYQLISAPVT
ncbi:nucleotidyltransferase family protein, partial [Mycobacterium kansasii]